MATRRAFILAFASITASLGIACGGAPGSDESTGEEELRATERGFEYDCKAPANRTLIEKASTKVLITDGHLRFDGDFGPSLGARDKAFKAPKGSAQVRYDGFETGDDCVLKVVADDAALKGKPSGKVRLQCAGDGFQEDVLTCSGPKAATFKSPKPPAPPPPPPAKPPANAKKWSCSTTASIPTLGSDVTMQVVDGSIRVVTKEFEYTGTRDRDYHPRSGNWIAYDDVEFGGDCSLSLVVDGKAIVAATTQTTLKVRCAGDVFEENRYTCKAK